MNAARQTATHHISAPTPSPSSRKVWQACSKTRHWFTRVDTSRFDQAVLLNRHQSEIMSERVSRGDKVCALLNDRSASCLVCSVDHQGKVLWAHKRWAGRANEVKSRLEPFDGLGETGKIAGLPDHQHLVCFNVSPSHSLAQSLENVVHCPSALTKVLAEWVSEIIVLHDPTKGVHPSFETAVNERTEVGDSVSTVTACGQYVAITTS
jgi:hypothetical protein